MEKAFSPHTTDKKRELGAYYTPRSLSQVLCDWAITSVNDRILEPSFGGCGFLESSVRTLKNLGGAESTNQLHGVDIDPEAFKFLAEKIGTLTEINGKNFICGDFLETTSTSFCNKKFDVIIGNPPYVSIHKMVEKQKLNAYKSLKESEYYVNTIGRNPSLWAFFLLHSLSLIEKQGRMAWVLPSSLLHTDYSKNVIAQYCRYFSKVSIVKLYERFFLEDGATEVSVILFAEGFDPIKKDSCEATYSEMDNLNKLRDHVFSSSIMKESRAFKDGLKLDALSKNTSNFYKNIQTKSFVKKVRDVADVKIGMVTGDSKTFVINAETANKNQLNDDDLLPVISRFSQLKGLHFSKQNHTQLLNKNRRVLLVSPKDITKKHTPIRNYLATVSRKKRRKNQTFPKRKNWFHPNDNIKSDAFLSCMLHDGVRLVINNADINCTNSIYRVFFNEGLSKQHQKAIAVSMLSSLTQLSVEVEGRSYGSGVLKLEPTAAKKILIFFNDAVVHSLLNIYTEVNQLLHKNNTLEARRLVDSTIGSTLGISQDVFLELETSIMKLRMERYKGLSKKVISE